MRNLLLSILVLLISSAAIAQNETGFKFNVGPELGFAAGSFSNTHSVGTGVTIQAEYQLLEKLRLTGTFGLLVTLENRRARI